MGFSSTGKVEGPTTSISYLGILIDTVKGEVCLLDEKLSHIARELETRLTRKACSKHKLLSLIGLLHHVVSVVIPGRPFLCHFIELSKVPKQLDFMVCLNQSARSDILWWHTFVVSWNGRSLLPLVQTQITLILDALGSWGCSACCGSRKLQLGWSDQLHSLSIPCIEMLPNLLAAAVWGSQWKS